MYKDQQAKEELSKEIIIEDLVIVPTDLQKAIRVAALAPVGQRAAVGMKVTEVIQDTPFPEFVGGKESYEGIRITLD